MRIDPAAIPGAIANRVLERETWARQRLSAHAGRVFVIAVGPVATALAVDASGLAVSQVRARGAVILATRCDSAAEAVLGRRGDGGS